MAPTCFNCKAQSGSVVLHHLPTLAESSKKWLKVIPNVKPDDYRSASFRLCARHFDDMYILGTGRLSKNAIPTKFLMDNGLWCTINGEVPGSSVVSQPIENNLIIAKSSNQLQLNSAGFVSPILNLPSTSKNAISPTKRRNDSPKTSTASVTVKAALIQYKEELEKSRRNNRILNKRYKRLKQKSDNLEKFLRDLEKNGIIC